MPVANCFMEIKKYEKDENFNRNQAIYVLHTIDKTPLEEIAKDFQLAIEEVQEILTLHTRYEAAFTGTF